MKNSSIYEKAYTLITGQVLITILSIGSVIITARGLDVRSRGEFSIALVLPSILFMITEFGLGDAGNRLVAEGRWSRPVIFSSQLFAVFIRLVISITLGCELLSIYGEILFPNVNKEYLYLGLFQLVSLAICGSMLPMLMGLGKFKEYNNVLVGSSLLSFVALALFWWLFGLTVNLVLLINIVVGLFVSLVVLLLIRSKVGSFGYVSIPYLKEAYRFGVGIYISEMVKFSSAKIGVILINFFKGPTGVGMYGVAQTATEKIYLISDAFGTSLYSHVATNVKINDAQASLVICRLVSMITFFFGVVIAVFAEIIVRILFGEAYMDSVAIIRVLVISAVLTSSWLIISKDLNARGLSKVTSKIEIVSSSIGLISTIILLIGYGLLGVAMAAVITSLTSFLLGLSYYMKLNKVKKGMRALFELSHMEQNLINKIIRGIGYLMGMGPKFIWRLVQAYLLDLMVIRLTCIISPLLRRYRFVLELFQVKSKLNKLIATESNIQNRIPKKNLSQIEDLISNSDQLNLIKSKNILGDFVLGEYDHQGRLVTNFKFVKGVSQISETERDARRRSHIVLVCNERGVFVRKKYLGNNAEERFVKEVQALELLRDHNINVPEIIGIKCRSLTIDISFVGLDLGIHLAEMGADFYDVRNSNHHNRNAWNNYVYEGNKYIENIPDIFVESLERQIRVAHSLGLKLYDLKYGNIAVHHETGEPYLIDFDSSTIYKDVYSKEFLIERDRDIAMLNKLFKREFLTFKVIQNKLRCKNYPAAYKAYASTYIGHGLYIGQLWDRTIGFGRWHYILQDKYKDLIGCRILSLGVNNASIELLALRNGISEVTAFEQDEEYANQGQFLLAACQWADNKIYKLNYVRQNMSAAINISDKYDCVMALCSLYYLNEFEMTKVVKAMSSICPEFILQCNTKSDIGREEEDQYRRASLEYSINLLEENGYKHVKIFAPQGYSRPVLIGFSRTTRGLNSQ